MAPEDKSYIVRLFARVVAFIAVFIIVAIVVGFVSARLMGLQVDIGKFYDLVSAPFLIILGAIVGPVTASFKKDDH